MIRNKKRIKIDILDKFKEMESEVDSRLPKAWLKKDYFTRLNTWEKKTFEIAVAELASSGLVEYKPGVHPEIKLTRLGENLIYQKKEPHESLVYFQKGSPKPDPGSTCNSNDRPLQRALPSMRHACFRTVQARHLVPGAHPQTDRCGCRKGLSGRILYRG